jgi:hypothetical protein
MANIITFVDLAKPTGLSVAATASATGLVNGTYYYKVIAVFNTSSAAGESSGGKSLSSDESSVVITTGNKYATLTWNAVSGAGGYRVYRSTISGSYSVMLNIGLPDSVVNSGGVCTWVDTGISNASNNVFQDIAHGRLEISQDDYTTDVLSVVDLYNADVAGSWGIVDKLDNKTYIVKAYLEFTSATTWKDYNKTIILYDTWRDNLYATFGIKTAASGSEPEYYNRGCELLIRGWCLATTYFKELWCYDSYINSSDGYAPNPVAAFDSALSYNYINYRKGEVKFSFVNKIRSFAGNSSSDCFIDKVLLTRTDTGLSGGKVTLSNIFIDNSSRAFQTGTGSRIRSVGYVGGKMSLGDVLVLGSDWQVELVDSTPDARVLYGSGTAVDSFVRDIKTFVFTLSDEAGNPIEGVKVVIKDKNGTERFNDTTDSNGQVSDELYYRETTFSPAGVKTITSFNPFVFTFSKVGYETYETEFDITAKITQTVTLKKAVPILYTEKGELLVKRNKENQGNGRAIVHKIK